jgi:hypothetical protein
MRASEYKVRLVITVFDCPPEDITRILGIMPTKTWVKGDRRVPEAGAVVDANVWQLNAPMDPTGGTLGEHIDALLEVVRAQLGAFRGLPPCEIELGCTVYAYGRDALPISFSSETIRTLGIMGASIDVDMNDLTRLSEEVGGE